MRRREGQRLREQRPVNGSPHINDAVASLPQFLSLVGEVDLHALLGRAGDLVNVRSVHGAALGVGAGAADGVVEDEDSVGAGDVVEEDFLHFGVVVGFDVVVVHELGFAQGGDVLDDGEGVLVEGVGGFRAADVVDCHVLGGGAVVVLGSAFGLLVYPVVGGGAVGGGFVEVEFGFDVAAGDGILWDYLGLNASGLSACRGREVVGGSGLLG